MAVEKLIYKKHKLKCVAEGHKFEQFFWSNEPIPKCPECGSEAEDSWGRVNAAPAVHGDEIDIMIRHGICNDDGTPKRYTSKAEIRRAAAEKGLVIMGETPKTSIEYHDKWQRQEEERIRRRG